jgi:D-alanyl-D-alanine carboxypeptidase
VSRVVLAAILALIAGLVSPAAPAGGGGAPKFIGKATRIDGDRKERMTGRSWHRGCPVPISQLRLLRVRHWDFKGDVERGRLIVHEEETREVLRAIESLFRQRFPIRRMEVADAYGGDDDRLMNADVTSAFNCRFVAGTQRWSQHAYGRAVDINPTENPYVTPSGHVSPPAGRAFTDRSRDAEGLIKSGSSTVRAFKRVGWGWGGNWSGTKDYMHFSSNGR